MKIIKRLIVMLILLVFIISTVAATVHAVSVPKTDKQIESKEKVAKVKVTFNANGGKIGSKKTIATSVKKGAKLNKLTTPKRTGYSFLGWYTKKIGGKKISKNTKVSKKVTFYAHWKKKSRVLNTAEKELIGTWMKSTSSAASIYTFKSDGTYGHGMRIQIGSWPADSYYFEGIWNVNGGTLYMTDLKAYTAQGYAQWENGEWDLKNGEWKPYSLNNPNKKYNNYNLGVEDGRKYLLLEPDDGKMYRE